MELDAVERRFTRQVALLSPSACADRQDDANVLYLVLGGQQRYLSLRKRVTVSFAANCAVVLADHQGFIRHHDARYRTTINLKNADSCMLSVLSETV